MISPQNEEARGKFIKRIRVGDAEFSHTQKAGIWLMSEIYKLQISV